MKNIFKQMGRLLNDRPLRSREEAYLNGATSLVDLEMRMREVDNGRFRGRMG